MVADPAFGFGSRQNKSDEPQHTFARVAFVDENGGSGVRLKKLI
jgi:hypothetical protein